MDYDNNIDGGEKDEICGDSSSTKVVDNIIDAGDNDDSYWTANNNEAPDSVVDHQQATYTSPYAPITMDKPLTYHYQQKRDCWLSALVKKSKEPAWIVPACGNSSSYINIGIELVYMNSDASESDNMNKFIHTLTNLTITTVFTDMAFDQLMREFYFVILKPKKININWVNYLLRTG